MSLDIPALSFDWPHAYGGPRTAFKFKNKIEDFIVEEELGFELTGEGEHLCLWLEKKGVNTQYVAEKLAPFIKSRLHDVGYSGLKDRHGITRQWFSIPVKIGSSFDDVAFCRKMNEQNPDESVDILHQRRHQKKIRRGIHRANGFQIRLRSLEYKDEDGKANIEKQLKSIQQRGFPNYFGEQRFGREGQNVLRGLEWIAVENPRKLKPAKRGIYLSAIRSYLFNTVLAKRVESGSWNAILPGEDIMLDGSHSIFQVEDQEIDELQDRLDKKDIHPSGPLFGVDSVLSAEDLTKVETELLKLENSVLKPFANFFLHSSMGKMKAVRRSLRAIPESMEWLWEESDLCLKFLLPSGSYATALIRELGRY